MPQVGDIQEQELRLVPADILELEDILRTASFLAHTKQKVSNIVGLRPYG